MKRIFLPPLAPVFLLLAFAAFVLAAEMTGELRIIEGRPDNAPRRAAGLLMMLSPAFYVLCALVNAIEAGLARLLGRLHWVSLVIMMLLLPSWSFMASYKSKSLGKTLSAVLFSFAGSAFVILPMGLWRRWLSHSVKPSAKPDGGPANPLGNSQVPEGPTSVS